MAYRFPSMNLKARVILVVTGVVLAGIWVLAAHLSVILQADTEQLVAQQLSTQVDYIAKELDEELQTRINLLNELAAAITLGVPADATKVQRLLDEQKPSLVMFPLGIMITNKEGVVIADHMSNPVRSGGRFYGDRDFFRKVMANGKPLIGRPEIDRYSGQPMVPIAVALHDANGAVAGVLYAPFRNTDPDLFGKLQDAKIGKSGRFLLMSPQDGLVVAATEARQVMTPVPLRGESPMTDRRLYEGFEAAAVTTTQGGVEVLGASHTLSTPGWVLIGNITTEEAFAPIRTFKDHIYFAALLVSLLVAAILYLFLRLQLLPLESARAAMQRMTAGAENFAAIPVARDDEIGQLVESFNRLVAERQRIDDELARTSYRNQLLLRTASDGIHVLDAEGNVLEVSDAFCTMLGYTRAEMSSMNVSQWDAQWSATEVKQVVARLAVSTTAPAIFETRHQRRDGRFTDVEISSIGVELDGKRVLYCSARDVSERKRMAAAIHALNENLERRVAKRTAELERSQQELRALTELQDSIQEEERKRIARELHDELSQNLTVLKFQLQFLTSSLPPQDNAFSAKVQDMNMLLTDTMRAVHSIAANLRSTVLDELGLRAAVRDLVDAFSQSTGIKCELREQLQDIVVEPRVAAQLYRMAQESLTNVARHAHANSVLVSLYQDASGSIILSVKDDGQGMPDTNQRAGRSFGLIGMRERAVILGGELTITSSPGKGTSVEIKIPHVVSHLTPARTFAT